MHFLFTSERGKEAEDEAPNGVAVQHHRTVPAAGLLMTSLLLVPRGCWFLKSPAVCGRKTWSFSREQRTHRMRCESTGPMKVLFSSSFCCT